MDEDDLRFCFRFIIIMQMASAHHKRYIPGVRPYNPYLLPYIRLTGKLDGVCRPYVAKAALVSRFVKKMVYIIR
jgi:hypothetical protein